MKKTTLLSLAALTVCSNYVFAAESTAAVVCEDVVCEAAVTAEATTTVKADAQAEKVEAVCCATPAAEAAEAVVSVS